MIDIVIVNYNSGHLLDECCNSILFHSSSVVKNLIVVDNASCDNSARFLKSSTQPKTNLISLDENIGFAAACNLGASYSETDYILFLNPDTLFISNPLDELLAILDEDKFIGIAGVQILDEFFVKSKTCYHFPTFLRFLADSTGFSKIFKDSGTTMNKVSSNKLHVVDQVIGAFFLVRKTLFRELEGFDERFFMYYEEVDVCYRSKKLGFKTVYFSGTQIVHYGCISAKKVRSKSLFYLLRSRILYAHKHFNKLGQGITLIAIFFAELPLRVVFEYAQTKLTASPSMKSTLLLSTWLFKKLFNSNP